MAQRQEETNELEKRAKAVLEAGQAIDLGQDGRYSYVSLPLRIERIHARLRISKSSGGPIVDATTAADTVPAGNVHANVKLRKDLFVNGDPKILGEIVRQLQWNLRDGLEIKNLALAPAAKEKLPPNLTIK